MKHGTFERAINVLGWGLGLVCVVAYAYVLFAQPGIAHSETSWTVPGLLEDRGLNVFHDALVKTFDQGLVERYHYRPRALAFFIHWADCHLARWLTLRVPAWGFRFPFTLLAGALIIAFAYGIFKTLAGRFGTRINGLCFFAATALALTPALFSSVFLIMRSNKILNAAVALGLFLWFLKDRYIPISPAADSACHAGRGPCLCAVHPG